MDPSSEHWPVIMLMFLCIVILTEYSVHGPVLRTLAGHNADVPMFLYSNTYRVQCTWTRPQNIGRS